MRKTTDIPSRREGLQVPEGYFDSLKTRLAAIPSAEATAAEAPRRSFLGSLRSPARVLVPGFAAVAAAVAILLAVLLPTRSSDGILQEDAAAYESYVVADLIPRTDPWMFFDDDPSVEP